MRHRSSRIGRASRWPDQQRQRIEFLTLVKIIDDLLIAQIILHYFTDFIYIIFRITELVELLSFAYNIVRDHNNRQI